MYVNHEVRKLPDLACRTFARSIVSEWKYHTKKHGLGCHAYIDQKETNTSDALLSSAISAETDTESKPSRTHTNMTSDAISSQVTHQYDSSISTGIPKKSTMSSSWTPTAPPPPLLSPDVLEKRMTILDGTRNKNTLIVQTVMSYTTPLVYSKYLLLDRLGILSHSMGDDSYGETKDCSRSEIVFNHIFHDNNPLPQSFIVCLRLQHMMYSDIMTLNEFRERMVTPTQVLSSVCSSPSLSSLMKYQSLWNGEAVSLTNELSFIDSAISFFEVRYMYICK